MDKLKLVIISILGISLAFFAVQMNLIASDSDDIFEAVKNNQLKVVQRYIQQGGDVNVVDENGKTPLLVAILYENYEVFELLVMNNADVNYRNLNANPKMREGIMELASLNEDIRYLELALNKGGNPNGVTSYKRPIIIGAITRLENTKLLIDSGADIDATGANGNTPLIRSVLIKQFDVSNYLINEGANPNVKNKMGLTVIDFVEKFGDAAINPNAKQYKYYRDFVDSLGLDFESLPKHNN